MVTIFTAIYGPSFHYDVLGAARVMSDDGGSGWEEDEAAGWVCDGEWVASESCRGFPQLSENNRVWLNLDNCEMYISNAVKTRRRSPYKNQNLLKNVYHCLVEPRIYYSICLWGAKAVLYTKCLFLTNQLELCKEPLAFLRFLVCMFF